MVGMSGSSSGAVLHGGKGNMYKHEVALLATSGERLENGEFPRQLMSQDEGLLASLGYKQGR